MEIKYENKSKIRKERIYIYILLKCDTNLSQNWIHEVRNRGGWSSYPSQSGQLGTPVTIILINKM